MMSDTVMSHTMMSHTGMSHTMMSHTMMNSSMMNHSNSMMSYSSMVTTGVAQAMVGGGVAIQGVVAIGGLRVAISLFVIEIGVNVTIAIGLVSPCICLMAVTVISPKPMDINSGAPSWCVHLSSITISIVLALCPV